MDATPQERIVLDFIGAYGKSWPPDLEAALRPLAEDAYYQIVVPTTEPVRGRANILRCHQRMKERVADQKHDMKVFGSRGNTVFTERVDYSLDNGHWSSIPLCAVFELNDAGEIIAWREYLDLANTARQHKVSTDTLLQMLEKLG
jgi:limonene-1,2-epoxide hydrolase